MTDLKTSAPDKYATAIERILGRLIEGPNGCVLWSGALTRKGYGQTSVGGKSAAVHRLIYVHFKGPIPDGLEIDHLCRVRNCANPDHLEAVTHQENLRRGGSPVGVNAQRTHCVNGHEFSPENTITCGRKGGRARRKCRACYNAARRRHRAQQRNLTEGNTRA